SDLVVVPAQSAGAYVINTSGIVAKTSGTFTLGQPDLIVTGSSKPLSSDGTGTWYGVTFAVQNIGSASSGQSIVAIWDHGYIDYKGVPALSPGGYAVLGYSAYRTYPSGDCSILLTADYSHLVAESDEG